MIAKTTTTTHLAQMLAQARAATDALFGLVRPGAFHDRPVPERHRTIFYFGHLEAFDWNLVRQAAGVPSFHPEFDQLFAFGVDPDPAKGPKITTWCKDYFDALHQYSAGGAYVNFMMEEGQERVQAAYRDNYDRLVEIKSNYDPENLFRVNQNLRPPVTTV